MRMHRLKKNQMIITGLAVMIAVTGYLNYTKGLKNELSSSGTVEANNMSSENQVSYDTDIDVDANGKSDDGMTSNTATGEPSTDDDGNVIEPGSTILTSASVSSDIIAQAQLSREQVRAALMETLLNIVDNENIDEASKTSALNQITQITDDQNREAAIELLLEAKGFTGAVVSIVDGECDVVLNVTSISDTERAQVEDIVKRKSGFAANKITISLCK